MEHLDLIERCNNCKLCDLHINRINGKAVVYRGKLDALVMWIAEAPGEVEAKQAQPLVGPTGSYLQEGVEAIELENDSYFCNIAKCWPGKGNPDPKKTEKDACRPYLLEQIDIVKPRLIVAVGRHAFDGLFPGEKVKITEDHGKVYSFGRNERTIPVVLQLHPSYIKRKLNEGIDISEDYWNDFLIVRKMYDKIKGEL